MKDNKGERKDGLIASQSQSHKKFRKQIWDETICVLLKVRLRRDCHQDLQSTPTGESVDRLVGSRLGN